MKPITLKSVAQAVNGKISDEKYNDVVIENITTDTRKISEGDLFIPLKGENFDGHKFIEQAFEKGALCCLSAENTESEKAVIYVSDTRKALRDLAEYYISLFDIPVVGITGSVGKTTTKDMIASVLMQKYNVLKTEGNFNNEIGLPLTVFKITEDTQVAVLEMGMNSFGEIHNLSKIAKPDIAVITNVGVSHIENLGSREGILKAKCEIFDFMKDNGTAVLNIDNDMLQTLEGKTKFNTLWYGVENKKDIYADNIVKNGVESISCDIHMKDENFSVYIPVPGEHMVLNAMAAALVGNKLGLTVAEIKRGIEEFVPTKMRMAVIKTEKGTTIINDVYNANPVSMKAGIDVLSGGEGEKICILGDMFELGQFAKEMHYDTGVYAAQKKIDKIICIGEISKSMYEGALSLGGNAFYFETQDEFIEKGIEELVSEGATVLVKASRGMHFEKTAEKIQEVK
ncbi:MAG TPA: UDP-N-acetylmuramoyl-tripeptide--D-alanyl-D-alanine ligase [Candidatus Fimicola cottocaccae]|nr:UDP-N-acetylmuramoyl-tripeptide--D-alanyl-D-alanine ligase [Candidatus Fimicola cottocaccae]